MEIVVSSEHLVLGLAAGTVIVAVLALLALRVRGLTVVLAELQASVDAAEVAKAESAARVDRLEARVAGHAHAIHCLRWPEFTVFAPVFGSSDFELPVSLLILNLGDVEKARAVAKMVGRAARNEGAERGIQGLFEQPGWRPHILGALAVVVSPRPEEHLDVLWARIAAGSWVCPQLAAAASLVDAEFNSRVREWVIAPPSPTLADETAALSPASSHSLVGPWSADSMRGKTLNALLALCDDPVAQERAAASKQVRTWRAADRDSGGQIAIRWRTRICALRDELADDASSYW